TEMAVRDSIPPAMVFYPEGVARHSPGSRSAPWETGMIPARSTPKGLYRPCRKALSNPFRVGARRGRLPTQGALSRPWAVESNPFGVESHGLRCRFAHGRFAKQSRRGYTLLEMLLATVVSVLLLGALYVA